MMRHCKVSHRVGIPAHRPACGLVVGWVSNPPKPTVCINNMDLINAVGVVGG
ncbi:MAG: hypothetical protein IJ143_03800 [Neisseriaceae bacterium]|nr:hypothetical protein [Neisseriaceae bacterium]